LLVNKIRQLGVFLFQAKLAARLVKVESALAIYPKLHLQG